MPTPAVITGADVDERHQAMRYEIAVLSFRLVDVEQATAGVQPWVEAPDARGRLLGCWTAENGPLGRLYVLRSFVDDDELTRERRRFRFSPKPFGAGSHLTDLSVQSFAPFPFMPPVVVGAFGPFYEIRDYHLVPGGLVPTIDGWREALPGRHLVDPITVVMYALDGPDRIIQIWPFTSLDARIEIRRDLYAKKMWPPPGGPEHILDAVSIIALPTAFSPLS
jgi:hypothetical protein